MEVLAGALWLTCSGIISADEDVSAALLPAGFGSRAGSYALRAGLALTGFCELVVETFCWVVETCGLASDRGSSSWGSTAASLLPLIVSGPAAKSKLIIAPYFIRLPWPEWTTCRRPEGEPRDCGAAQCTRVGRLSLPAGRARLAPDLAGCAPRATDPT